MYLYVSVQVIKKENDNMKKEYEEEIEVLKQSKEQLSYSCQTDREKKVRASMVTP